MTEDWVVLFALSGRKETLQGPYIISKLRSPNSKRTFPKSHLGNYPVRIDVEHCAARGALNTHPFGVPIVDPTLHQGFFNVTGFHGKGGGVAFKTRMREAVNSMQWGAKT